jgi:methylenetetrahydrofolate reductase (NADPH)
MNVSFEFFPAASDEARNNLSACAADLARFGPEFVSVTYGAGGTSQDRTLGTITALLDTLPVAVAGHLTTVNQPTGVVQQVIDTYRDLGVGHIVALRGDPPANGPERPSGYRTAADLVEAIRSRPDGAQFEISVAAYPEVHPKAASAEADLDNLKRKLDAGANRAITQFFFDPETFLRFCDRARAAGIEAPIVPGIMPISNFTGVRRFAERCGASIPTWIARALADLDDDPEVRQLVAATIAVEQCQQLSDRGIDSFHFYTMNRRHLTAAICHRLGLPATSGELSGTVDPTGELELSGRTSR